ncbi:MAG: hypothetical protein WB626_08185 [Bacteroidota bacterium]
MFNADIGKPGAGGSRILRRSPVTHPIIHHAQQTMPAVMTDLLTAGNIARALGVSDAEVKKAIQELGLKPKAKKGVCNYYGREILPKVKGALR